MNGPSRMGAALGPRINVFSFVFKALTATLPRFDPSKFGVADYSFYEGLVDFSLAKANGLKRPVIRVGQGYYGIDSQFKASSANSKNLFDRRDFYWMLDTKQSANGQALVCANALKTNGMLDPDSILFADFELATADASFLWGFIATLKSQLLSLRIGIYTGYSYWNQYGSADPKFGFAQYPLWIAWPVSPYIAPKPLAPWTTYLYHQWTFAGDGKFYGTQSVGLDLDYQNPAISPAPTPIPAPAESHTITIKYKDGTSDQLQVQDHLSQPLDNAAEVDVDSVPFLRVVPVPPPPVPPTPPPSTDLWFRVKHDQELPPYYKPRMLWPNSHNNPTKGIPETVNLNNSNPVKLSKGWQLFIAALIKQNAPEFTPDQVDRAYRSLLGDHEAWSNGTGYGSSPRADYVGKRDLDAPLPMLDRGRTSGGNVVKVLDGGKLHNVAGHPHYRVETLKESVVPDPMQVNYAKTPWLVFNCTTVTPFKIMDTAGKWTGRWRCNRFPQLGDRDVPMPLITDVGYGFIPVERLEQIDSPFGHSAYVFA